MIIAAGLLAAALCPAYAAGGTVKKPATSTAANPAPPPGANDPPAPPPGANDPPAPPPGANDPPAPPPGANDPAPAAPGGTAAGPPPGAGESTAPGADKATQQFNQMYHQLDLHQNDPAAYAKLMQQSGAAYDGVFGKDSFASLKKFEESCRSQCDNGTWMHTADFFNGANRLADLENGVKNGTLPPNSGDYRRQDQSIRHELKTSFDDFVPKSADPANTDSVVSSYHAASEPIMQVVMTPQEHEQNSQNTAQQTGSSPSYNNLGNVLLHNGNATAAQGAYTQAIGRDGSNASAYSGRAQADYNLGDFPAAAKDAASALDLNPSDDAARSTLLLSERRLPQGSWPELHNDLAKSAAGAGVGAMSTQALEDGAVVGGGAGAALPSSPAADLGAASAQARAQTFVSEARKDVQVGDSRAAVAALQKAIAANPRDAEAFSLQAIAYSRLKDYPQMLAAAEGGLALAPKSRVLLNSKAFALNHLKDYKRALEAASRALELDPRDAVAHFNKAHALAGLGDRKAMIAELKEAASLDSKFEAAYNASIQLPESSDLTLLFPDDKPAGAPSLLELAMKQSEDPGWGAFAVEAGVGALLVLAAAFAIKRLFGGQPV